MWLYVFMMFYCLIINNYSNSETIGYVRNNGLKSLIIVLVILLIFMLSNPTRKIYWGIVFRIAVILLIFCINRTSIFSPLHETVFILILLIILVLGYRIERLIASYLITPYSFLFSRPVLPILFVINKFYYPEERANYDRVLRYFLLASFMVKFPIFGFHYRLPVAHAEASTIGPIVLAGVLLKIGGAGLYYIAKSNKLVVKINWLLLGLIPLMSIILELGDLKTIIAYSSITHIRTAFFVSPPGKPIGHKGGSLIILNHGIISPLILRLVGLMLWFKSRSLTAIKLVFTSVILIYIVFLLLILNIGFPPFMGFLAEICLTKVIVFRYFAVTTFGPTVPFRGFYNLYLLWCAKWGNHLWLKTNVIILEMFIFLMILLHINIY